MLHYDPERRATAGEMLRHPWLAGPSGAPVAPTPAAHSAAEERECGGSPGGTPGEGTFLEGCPAAERGGGRHAGARRRAFSGRSRSRSASPGGGHRSRYGSLSVPCCCTLSAAGLVRQCRGRS